MAGIKVFRELHDAIAEGWQVYDRHVGGYLVRRFTGGRWELAIVDLHVSPAPRG